MGIRDLMIEDFGLVESHWPRQRGLRVASSLGSKFVIVRHAIADGAANRFYLLPIEEFRSRLKKSRAATTGDAIDLVGIDPIPTVSVNASYDPSLTYGLVIEGDHPVGILQGEARSFNVMRADANRSNVGRVMRGTHRSEDQRADRELSGSDGSPTKAARRSLIADLPAIVEIDEPLSLIVMLSAARAKGRNVAEFRLPVGTKLDIVVKPLERLKLVGTGEGTLQVQDPQPDNKLLFKFLASDAGKGRLCVYAFHNGASVATLELATDIVTNPHGAKGLETRPITSIALAPRIQPDLSIFIFERDKELTFHLQSADGRFQMNRYGPVILHTPLEYFREFFRKIENIPLDHPERRAEAKTRLEQSGLHLFNAIFPDELRATLWELRDRIKSLQIMSDEPWIPWEVCMLNGEIGGGRVENGKFFAEAFNVTRWIHGVSAAQQLSLKNWALIVPNDSGLARAAEEKQYVEELKTARRSISCVSPTFEAITKAMSSGTYDTWHFTGHARANQSVDANRSSIELLNGATLEAKDIAGEAGNVLLSRPFVFLNACQSAQGGMSLTGVGGWAQQFLPKGSKDRAASAFIGCYWSVDDDHAFRFAKALYRRLMKGKPIGEAAREARLEIRDEKENDPTWLSYTVYADPAAVVQGTQPARRSN
jgi:hypothetical protein